MNRQYVYSGLIAFLISLGTIGAFNSLNQDSKELKVKYIKDIPSKSASFSMGNEEVFTSLNFEETAKEVVNSVVHIKSSRIGRKAAQQLPWNSIPDPFKDFFGERYQKEFFFPQRAIPKTESKPIQIGTGSGVIVSEDGFIITNNHVIEQAEDIEVCIYDNRCLKARVIGTDPTTDLALLRIDANNLPSISFADSETVDIGQWVLAVGNPMGLNSTVTAGIVSAKGRSINILKEEYAVENFIQTDAAINPGNSGGALVNLKGELIGINTAIASPTGSFAGYGFAIPTNLVSKVMQDLRNFGAVQKGILGIRIRTVDANLAKEKDLNINTGVYVDSLLEKSAAGKSGVKTGDVIIGVNDKTVKTSAGLQGEIGQYSPGDEVKLKVLRKGREKEILIKLNNSFGESVKMSEEDAELNKLLGVAIQELSKQELNEFEIEHGLMVKKIYSGRISQNTKMKDGFILTHVDGDEVKTKKQLLKILNNKNGGLMMEGIYKDVPGKFYYAFGLD